MDDQQIYSNAMYATLYSGSLTLMEQKPVRDSMEGSEQEIISTQVGVEVHVRGREETIRTFLVVNFLPSGLPGDVEQLTDYVTELVMEKLDSDSCRVVIFEDERHNKVMIKKKIIDAISVQAPDSLPEEWEQYATDND